MNFPLRFFFSSFMKRKTTALCSCRRHEGVWEGARTCQVQLRWSQADGAGKNNMKLPPKFVRSLSNSSSYFFFSLPPQTALIESQVLKFPPGKATVRGWETLAAPLEKPRCRRPLLPCPARRRRALDPSRAQTCSGLVPAASRVWGSSRTGGKQREMGELKSAEERPRSTTAPCCRASWGGQSSPEGAR